MKFFRALSLTSYSSRTTNVLMRFYIFCGSSLCPYPCLSPCHCPGPCLSNVYSLLISLQNTLPFFHCDDFIVVFYHQCRHFSVCYRLKYSLLYEKSKLMKKFRTTQSLNRIFAWKATARDNESGFMRWACPSVPLNVS